VHERQGENASLQGGLSKHELLKAVKRVAGSKGTGKSPDDMDFLSFQE
jgi:hypothetical protein